jgi:hypothetical protein
MMMMGRTGTITTMNEAVQTTRNGGFSIVN